MNIDKKAIITGLLTMILGAIIGFNLSDQEEESTSMRGTEKKEPLYWVAPMDPNYRRDEPGKSPMGMDLIPVYEEGGVEEHGPGVTKISPDVVHNLGVRIAEVKQGILHSEIKTVGYVKYDEEQLKHIHPRVEGWIEKLYIKASGDPVTKDQPLYELYSPQLVNAQEEYLSALSRDNKSLIAAVENRLNALQLSNSFIEQLKRQRKVKQAITFNAPQGGVVDNLNIREGFYVKPGTTLMSIGKLDEVWVEVEIFERQASLVKEGLPVTMTLDYLQGKQWLGEVDYVYPALDPKTRTLRVRLRFNNQDGILKPNMFAEVKIFADSKEQFLLVPNEAVIRTGTHNVVVLALGKGQFKSIEVELGASDEKHIAITKGLNAGDQVVVSAQFLLDSESSKTSDFKRMHHAEDEGNMEDAKSDTESKSAFEIKLDQEEVDHSAHDMSH
jgi:Cu(I)/Ag(I) efflux system membrane fusion protein